MTGNNNKQNQTNSSQDIFAHWKSVLKLLTYIADSTTAFVARFSEEIELMQLSIDDGDSQIQIKQDDLLSLSRTFRQKNLPKETVVEINSSQKLEEWLADKQLKGNYSSYLALPIYHPENKIFGIIGIASKNGGSFPEKTKTLLLEMQKLLEQQLKHKQQHEKLENTKKIYQTIFENAPIGLMLEDEQGKILEVNEVLCQLSGYSKEEIEGSTIFDIFVLPEQEELARENIARVLAGEDLSFDIKNYDKEGNQYYTHIKETRVTLPDGRPGIISMNNDITKRKELNQKLQTEKEKFASLFSNTPDPIIEIDSQGDIVNINDEFIKKFKYQPGEIIGENIDAALKQSGRKNSVNKSLTAKLLAGEMLRKEVRRFDREGNPYNFLLKTVPITVEDEVVGGYAIYSDITERKKKEQELIYKTNHDELTGLHNRSFLIKKLEELNKTSAVPLSIIMIDVNGLKIINDTFGHSTGDKVLKTVAEVLENLAREQDLVVRYGGDEFIILMPQTEITSARVTGEKIRQECDKRSQDNMPISLGMGFAVKNNPQEDLNGIIKEADDRMMQDKMINSKSQKNRIVKGLLDTLGAKSDETKEHAVRMEKLAQKLGKKIGVAEADMRKLSLLATLHDIGKTSIPEEILTKPGRPTEKEWEMLKSHPERGYKIAAASEEFSLVAEEILSHHERWDGQGYPRGLKEDEIPLLARIISLVDAYDVMTNGRPYQKAISREEALTEIKACAGTQFDPELAVNFVKLFENNCC